MGAPLADMRLQWQEARRLDRARQLRAKLKQGFLCAVNRR